MSGEASAKTTEAIVELMTRICETPAPTFEEGERGRLVAGLLEAAGLEPVIDEVGNVIARVPGGRAHQEGRGTRLVVAAHLDTVFPADTDVTVRREGGRLHAPGLGDNSASLALLVHYVATLAPTDARPDLTVAATVGEEGLGDLYGVRHLLARRAGEFDAFVALDGHLGTVVGAGVGSKRFEVSLRARGGHSWGDFPNPSAIHALGDVIHALNRLKVPREPRSSYNVGVVSGGKSINAIAEEARFNLDLRSLDAATLAGLERDALQRIRRVARRHEVECEVTQVGDRPVAVVDNRALVDAARRALAGVGITARTAASSTDANAAMAAGLPAIAFGIYRGGDAHRLSEWVDPASLATGLEALRRLMAELSGESGSGAEVRRRAASNG